MQIQQRQGKTKYTYVTDQSTPPINSKRETTICLKCQSWQQKSQELIWGYEELLSAKEKELQTMTTMVNQLDDKLRKAYSKIDNLNRKIQGYESQAEKGRGNQEIINYYKEREEDLLAQLHAAENELFAKNVLIKDEIDSKEDRALTELLDQPKNNKPKPNTSKTDASLIPIISTTETLGKMLQRNICDLQKMSQEKMMLQVKHRMAVLRAVQLSVLK